MIRASYRNGIDFIAQMEDCDLNTVHGPNGLVGTATVFLMAELFGVSQEHVAEDVIRRRKQVEKMEKAAERGRARIAANGGKPAGLFKHGGGNP